MNRPTKQDGHETGNMDDVGRLIRLAGAREDVPGQRFERSRRVVQDHWEMVVAEQRGDVLGRRRVVLAAAAVVVLALVVSILRMMPGSTGLEPPAMVARVLGEALANGEAVGQGGSIQAGTSILTDTGSRVALHMSGGQSLRMDSGSHVIVHTPNRVSLEAGAVYIDTALAENELPIQVVTPFGMAQDIGTQFQVRLEQDSLVVGVRHGLVEIHQPGLPAVSVDKGYFVELAASGEQATRPLPASDPGWDWVETVVPAFEINDATLAQYLEWYARESGLELVWADTVSETNARQTRLVGSIAGTSLDDGLVVVRQIAAFEYELTDSDIRVTVE